jgi:DNA-binding winged helix-turn-helix (wHTH) protein
MGLMARVSFRDFVLDPDRRQLLRDGIEVHLTPKAFDLLALLIERAPAVVTKVEIHERLWPATFVSDVTLAGLVKEVRQALGGDRDAPAIRTVHRVGYAFAEPLDTRPQPGAAATTHWLVVGDRRIALRSGVNIIGRDPAAAVWLDVPGVSRRHAQIVLDDRVVTLEDLGSKNGTLCRDRPVRERVRLRHGDRIQIASEVLVLYEPGAGLSTITQ